MIEITEIQKKLQTCLKPNRYEHTLGVMYTAAALAMCHGEDLEKAMLAGLLHDCGKAYSVKEQLAYCIHNHIPLDEVAKKAPALIHAKLGAYLAQHEYDVVNPDILDAICCHTTGHPNMTMLEKILYVSDYIEPGRKVIPALLETRKVCFSDINRAVALIAGATLSYLKANALQIDRMTIETYEYYSE